MSNPTTSTVTELMTELESDPEWETEYAQMEMMWEYVDGVLDPLIERLNANDNQTRKRAATALGWTRDADAVEALTTTLRTDPALSVREAAARALGEIGDPKAIEPLCEALKSADSPVRETAAVALGNCGAVDDLQATLRNIVSQPDPDDEFHAAVLRGLGRAATPEASAVLEERLADGDPDATERERIAYALRTHRTDRARAILRELITDDTAPVRVAAIGAIGDAVPHVAYVHEPPTWRERVTQTLGIERIDGPLATEVCLLIDRLDDESTDVRRHAARVLGLVGNAGLLAGLHRRTRDALKTLAKEDSDEEVREAATRAISRMDG